MKRFTFMILAIAGLILGAASVHAQDVTITNARIVVGNGTVIDNGSIVVRGGKIVSVVAGKPAATAGKVIDAKGMSAMPGFIDAHKHINNFKADQMQDLLEAGYTTILSALGSPESVQMLRDQIESGAMNGPRLIVSGPVNIRMGSDVARQQVDALAAKGVKWTGEIVLTPEPGPTDQEIAGLEAAVEEAAKMGITVQVHAVSTPTMVAAVDAGVRRLVHLPTKDWVTRSAAQKLASTNTIILGTIGFGAPVVISPGGTPIPPFFSGLPPPGAAPGVPQSFPADNKPRFRSGGAWPDTIVGANVDDQGKPTGAEAGYMIVNARTVWDQGALLGYCTDTEYEARAGLEHELKSYNVVFSTADMVKIMGPNTAAYLNMSDQLGTLEPGKLADIVLQDGNPLEGYWNWLKVRLVVKGGKVVVDKRT
jgi:imidazolonepropionase-like amidohydrolase